MMTTFPTKERRAGMVKSDRHHWTYDDLRNLPETLDRYEIIDGVLYMSPSPNVQRHQAAAGELYALLREWVRGHHLGRVYFSPADIVLENDRVLQPDVFFIRRENLDKVGVYVACVPDLVVEVLSPATSAYDRDTKFGVYEQCGVGEYWIADPEAKTIEIYHHTGKRFELHGRFERDDEARSVLLNGLSFVVRDVFPGGESPER